MATSRKCFTNYKVGSQVSLQAGKGRFRKGSTLDKVYRAARDVGMTRKQALEFVADSLASALVATKSPLARAVVEEEGRKTTALVMAIRERNARGKVAA
jgi:hypothetical protein